MSFDEPPIKDLDGILGKSSSALDGSSGYDTEELEHAQEVMSQKTGDEKGFLKVDPLFIPVSNGYAVREEEWEARSVIIEYDKYDNIVSVELL